MINSFEKVNEVKLKLSEKELYIHFVIDLAFTIKKLIKDGELDFSTLIDPAPSNEWENLAVMLPYLPKKIVTENLDDLLEGFMDLNWPGSKILYGYLAEMDIEPLKSSFSRVIRKAIDLDDSDWVWFLMVFMKSELVDLEELFLEEIELGLKYLENKGIEFD
ncbi:hypothetical protein [Acinetobacter populi]|uniref:DUF5071 domain-containing protein n=1 Tax=Acinetobacter populi TaxID=1582270 RepID=A0A1Z9Z1D7_9GAMM|nr:hypothetical protein [Acinetobacter populi]OUY08298.1 hypothetical protein CAP51_01360 [Acinetobacter populi]